MIQGWTDLVDTDIGRRVQQIPLPRPHVYSYEQAVRLGRPTRVDVFAVGYPQYLKTVYRGGYRVTMWLNNAYDLAMIERVV